MIDLSQCTTVKSADLKSKKRNSFEISTPETTFLMYADTEKEKDDWIGSVGKSIVRCSNTYYRTPATNSNAPDGSSQQPQTLNQQDDDDDIYSDDGNGYFNDWVTELSCAWRLLLRYVSPFDCSDPIPHLVVVYGLDWQIWHGNPATTTSVADFLSMASRGSAWPIL